MDAREGLATVPSINVDLGYFIHRKTDRVMTMLGKASALVPIRLWIYTAQVSPEQGTLTAASTLRVETEVQWWGKRGQAIEALLAAGFLEKQGENLVVHDWAEWQPHLVKYALKQRLGRLARKRDPPVIHTINRQLDLFSVDKSVDKYVLHCIERGGDGRGSKRIANRFNAAEDRPLARQDGKNLLQLLIKSLPGDRRNERLGPIAIYPQQQQLPGRKLLK